MRNEGKETEFFHRGKLIPKDTLEGFKRQKMAHTNFEVDGTAEVATPQNITYHTPKPQIEEVQEVIEENLEVLTQHEPPPPVPALSDFYGRLPHLASKQPTVHEVSRATTISDGNEEGFITQSEVGTQHTINQFAHSAPIPGEDIVPLSDKVLKCFSEQQFVNYLLDISNTQWITSSTFEHLTSVFLRRPTVPKYIVLSTSHLESMDHSVQKPSLLQESNKWTSSQQLDAYLELLTISTGICGRESLSTLHLRCRYAFLLVKNGQNKDAKAVYREMIDYPNDKDTDFILKLRCQLALSCMLISLNRKRQGYEILANAIPSSLANIASMIQNEDVQGFPFDCPPLVVGCNNNSSYMTSILAGLKRLLSKAYDRNHFQRDKTSFIQCLVELVANLSGRGFQAPSTTLDSFYTEVLHQISDRVHEIQVRDEIYHSCIRYYRSQANHTMAIETHTLLSADGCGWKCKDNPPAVNGAGILRRYVGFHINTALFEPCWSKDTFLEKGHLVDTARETESQVIEVGSDEEDLFPDEEDTNDNRSNYGTTYTNSTITGISYSAYMVP